MRICLWWRRREREVGEERRRHTHAGREGKRDTHTHSHTLTHTHTHTQGEKGNVIKKRMKPKAYFYRISHFPPFVSLSSWQVSVSQCLSIQTSLVLPPSLPPSSGKTTVGVKIDAPLPPSLPPSLPPPFFQACILIVSSSFSTASLFTHVLYLFKLSLTRGWVPKMTRRRKRGRKGWRRRVRRRLDV